MRKIETIDEIRSIQFDVLSAIDEFCRANSIMYSLAAGTLLGAVRHRGYIPWDDDIDICLKRDDYNKLMNLFPKIYKDRIALGSLERRADWSFPYAKAYDIRTLKVEKSSNVIKDGGIDIDIFPIDCALFNTQWDSFNKKRNFYKKLFVAKSLAWSKERSLLKNIFMVLSKSVLLPFSTRKLARIISYQAQRFNTFSNADYLFDHDFYDNRFPLKSFDYTIDVPFEGKVFKAMNGYHEYLACTYGDYLQLPPEIERVSHHSYEAYWK